jgi:predicted NUDIX family phosphoesterase
LRELNEELGFDLSQYNLHRLRELIGGGNFEVFYSEQNEVSKVHLCILLKLNINVNELKKLEDGVICEPEWLTPEELLAKHKSGERELEGWSEIALDFIN